MSLRAKQGRKELRGLQSLANGLGEPITRLSRLDLPTSGILLAAKGDHDSHTWGAKVCRIHVLEVYLYIVYAGMQRVY